GRTSTTSPASPRFGTDSRRITFIVASSGVGHRVGEQGELPRALDGSRHLALVIRAVAADPARDDLRALGHEQLQGGRVLVIDHRGLVRAEAAHLLSAEAPPSESGRHWGSRATARLGRHLELLLGSRHVVGGRGLLPRPKVNRRIPRKRPRNPLLPAPPPRLRRPPPPRRPRSGRRGRGARPRGRPRTPHPPRWAGSREGPRRKP